MIGDESRLASLSLDLDNQWSYMKTHGDAGWESFPSYLDIAVPRILDLLDRHGLNITFFLVGQDAALRKNRSALSLITGAGHEVGNHSFHHEPWLQSYTRAEVEAELSEAESAIGEATGARPHGFRGPGFSLSSTVLEVLKERGYEYDASTFPTFIGPLARTYYFFHSRLSRQERERRNRLFGGLRDGLRPLRAYRWDLETGPLLEIPVTTMPIFRVPFHLSYVLYLAGYSTSAARAYFRFALDTCRLAGVQPSLLLHPLDFLGSEDVDALRFFPAMQLPADVKIDMVNWVFAFLSRRFRVVPMSQHAEALVRSNALKLVAPDPPDGRAALDGPPIPVRRNSA